jgi:hypothetical protein
VRNSVQAADSDTKETDMNAQMYAVPGTSYMPASLEASVRGIPRSARRAVAPRGGLSTDSVADLLRAVGPLSVEDIAGGLAVSVGEAQAVVVQMVDDGCVRPDEWQRMKLQRRAGARAA